MNKLIFWLLVVLILAGLIYAVSSTLAPFIIAFIFAYILEPVIRWICIKLHIRKNTATMGVFIIFLAIFIGLLVLIMPIVYNQLLSYANKIPQYKASIDSLILSWSERIDKIDHAFADKISESGHNLVNGILKIISSFIQNIWEYAMATINFFTIIALVPVVLYYFLRDWGKIVRAIESLLPIKGKSKVREIFHSINSLLAAYIRGQLNICIILTCYYVIGLSIIGVDLSLLLGLFSGFMIIIPFIGILLSFLIVMTNTYFTFGTGGELFCVIILFIIGHIIESYILTPKIIGDKIGLHPVWIIFSVIAAANLFGFIGLFFAIPIAGIVKVLLFYLLDYYKSSKMYKN